MFCGTVSLLAIAKQKIPEARWHTTPLALYATAGLRLLPGNVSDSILAQTRAVLRASPFSVCTQCVRILDGILLTND